MHFRPRLVPTLFALAAVATTGSLGVWQLNRHVEKSQTRTLALERFEQSELTEAELKGDSNEWPWRKVRVTGKFIGNPDLIGGRVVNMTPGYGLIQSFETVGGQLILVDRGWIDRVDLPKTFEAATQADGDEVEISGQLRSVKGDAMARALEAPDFPAPVWAAGTMASIYAPYVNEMPPVYIVQGEPYEEGERRATDVQPVTGFIPHRASRSSLHYAFQWFGVCGLAILIWIMLAVHQPAVAQTQEKSATENQ